MIAGGKCRPFAEWGGPATQYRLRFLCWNGFGWCCGGCGCLGFAQPPLAKGWPGAASPYAPHRWDCVGSSTAHRHRRCVMACVRFTFSQAILEKTDVLRRSKCIIMNP